MNETNTQSNTCMACTCPCEMHKEHNHSLEEKGETRVCKMCGHEHKADGACDCGCK